MALALLSLVELTTENAIFEADIGTNAFYRYAIGQEYRTSDDFDSLEGVRYQSGLETVERSSILQSTFRFSIPLSYFDADTHFVQLHSYKTRDGRAPAWSKVLSVGVGHNLRVRMMSTTPTRTTVMFEPPRSVAFNLAENRLSSAMFWDQLFRIAGALIPIGSQLLGQTVNQQAGTQIASADIGNVLRLLLEAAQQQQSNGRRATNGSGTATTQSMPLVGRFVPIGSRTISYKNLRQANQRPYRLSRATDGGVISGPALIGLISTLAPSVLQAIGPLLQRAPELAGTLLDSPLRLYNAIAEANRREQQLTNEQVNSMLAAGNQALLYTLLNQAGATRSPNPTPPPAVTTPAPPAPSPTVAASQTVRGLQRSLSRVDEHVQVRFIPPALFDVRGQRKPLYLHDRSVSFHLALEPAAEMPVYPIVKAIAELRVKDCLDGRILFERSYQIREIKFGTPITLTLNAGEVARLPRNTDLLVSADISWMDERNQVHRATHRATQSLYLTGRYVLNTVGHRQGQPLALKNPQDYRVFWHLIWQGGSTTHRRWELDIQARYYHQLVFDQNSNGRIDTKFRAVAEDSKDTDSKVVWGGLMKAGMEFAVEELNKLLHDMNGGEMWSDEELLALSSDVFAKTVNQQATTAIKLRGRQEEQGNVWVFPVMDLVSITLHEVVNVGQDGQVAQTSPVERLFPVPIQAVFVGLKTNS